MNDPNIPDDSRSWDAIDIFLFSNGQQYSPPRKYHLKSDDLRCWHQTKTFLARSQYGSMHSAIDLYSLDGKKIEGPLELRNAAAYVAAVPPDAFIPAGYEKYLIKASRSREKRQEKLSNGNQIETTGKTGMVLATIEQIEGIIALTRVENSMMDTANTKQPQKVIESPTFPILNSTNNRNNKSYPKKKSSDSQGSPISKKNNFCSSKKNNDNVMKMKNSPLIPQKRCNKQQIITPKYSRNSKMPTRGSSELKANSRTISNFQNTKLNYDTILNPEIVPNQNDTNEYVEKVSDKNMPVMSNIYKNDDSDGQSMHVETNRKATIDYNSTKTSIEINKDNKHLIQEQNQSYMALVDNKGKINIQLRIKLEDFSSTISENHLTTDRSVITLIKKEMASQVNIDVILSKDIFNYNNRLILNGKSIESNARKNGDNTCNDEDVFVLCSCDNYTPKHSDLNDSSFKSGQDIQTETNEILESCCKCKSNQEKIGMSTCNNVVLNPTEVVTDKLENITNQSNPAENKPTKQTDFEDDVIIKMNEVPMTSGKAFDDKFVQTEWCNVLLQAKRHEDGRYTFHLPSLSLLKQYNLSQL